MLTNSPYIKYEKKEQKMKSLNFAEIQLFSVVLALHGQTLSLPD